MWAPGPQDSPGALIWESFPHKFAGRTAAKVETRECGPTLGSAGLGRAPTAPQERLAAHPHSPHHREFSPPLAWSKITKAGGEGQ